MNFSKTVSTLTFIFITLISNGQIATDSIQPDSILINKTLNNSTPIIALDSNTLNSSTFLITKDTLPTTRDTVSTESLILNDSIHSLIDTSLVSNDSITITNTDSTPAPVLDDSSISIRDTTIITPPIIEKKPIVPELTEVNLVVHVIDSVLGTPIKANIIMSTLNKKGKANGTGTCNSVGYFNFKLTPKSHFEITVMFPDYKPETLVVDLETVDNLTSIFKLDFKLKKFKIGDVIQLPNINFQQGDFHLQREAFPVIDKLITIMKENPQMAIKLKGHTDNTGSPNANLKLSQQRINEVRYYMIRKGIKLNRLKGEGYGDTKPIAPNNSPENMQKNRRVEFEVLKI